MEPELIMKAVIMFNPFQSVDKSECNCVGVPFNFMFV